MFENVNKLEEKIKKIKDYGINSLHISESMIYPDLTDIKQDIWLSKENKIKIQYLDEESNFEINLFLKTRVFLMI